MNEYIVCGYSRPDKEEPFRWEQTWKSVAATSTSEAKARSVVQVIHCVFLASCELED